MCRTILSVLKISFLLATDTLHVRGLYVPCFSQENIWNFWVEALLFQGKVLSLYISMVNHVASLLVGGAVGAGAARWRGALVSSALFTWTLFITFTGQEA